MIIPSECVDTVRTCCILDDDALNVSKHRPIFCQLNFSHAIQMRPGTLINTKSSIKWRSVKSENIAKYTEFIENSCLSVHSESTNCNTKVKIDELYEHIKSNINTISVKYLKHSSEYKPFLERYFDQELKACTKL